MSHFFSLLICSLFVFTLNCCFFFHSLTILAFCLPLNGHCCASLFPFNNIFIITNRGVTNLIFLNISELYLSSWMSFMSFLSLSLLLIPAQFLFHFKYRKEKKESSKSKHTKKKCEEKGKRESGNWHGQNWFLNNKANKKYSMAIKKMRKKEKEVEKYLLFFLVEGLK